MVGSKYLTRAAGQWAYWQEKVRSHLDEADVGGFFTETLTRDESQRVSIVSLFRNSYRQMFLSSVRLAPAWSL